MLREVGGFAVLLGIAAVPSLAQNSDFGITVPVTVSGGALRSGRLQSDDPSVSPFAEGFRVMLYPTLKLGSHWFAYSALQVRLSPYFYYDADDPERELYTNTIQAYIGYTTRTEKTTVVVKAGRLATAFGSFALRYDDTDNPLLDQPLPYVSELPLRGDQLPCGTTDLLSQYYGYVQASCGGRPGWGSGLAPVTLYGLPGVQVEAARGHFDGRLQLTASSPSISEYSTTRLSYAQWTAGAGYTIRQGTRIGVSAFRGPYLDRAVASFLPVGTSVRDFPATGIGVDGQWARGRWNVNGEWQRFQYDLPTFGVSPSTTTGYVEAKSVITPRLYVAGRVGYLKNGGVTDGAMVSAAQYAPTLTSLELGAGVWLRRNLLLKGSYEWLRTEGETGNQDNVVGLELVANIHAINWAFH
ncbi:MAG TPA: hypothetical protein VLY24_07820 [Bryobacteraceae bacterium]|nr:hypothetical protein [Bryobacteraceae bacterium]